MQTDAAVVPEATDATLEELVSALVNARMAEAIAQASLQEARTYLGERQRAWQAAQDQTRQAFNDLRRYIDHQAGIDVQYAGESW